MIPYHGPPIDRAYPIPGVFTSLVMIVFALVMALVVGIAMGFLLVGTCIGTGVSMAIDTANRLFKKR